ncbi:MAG: hypothetical protein AB7U82_22650 [Blastocatellales bacterium]
MEDQKRRRQHLKIWLRACFEIAFSLAQPFTAGKTGKKLFQPGSPGLPLGFSHRRHAAKANQKDGEPSSIIPCCSLPQP